MKGTYVLIIENSKDTEIEIGKIGRIAFKEGFYAYVGSALSGLERRIERHLRDPGDNKKLHWHIDYLLASPAVKVKEVVFAETVARRRECELAVHMNLVSITNFGCSDCRCKSHLFYSTSVTRLKEHVYTSFYESGFDLFNWGIVAGKDVEHLRATKINPV